MGGGSEAGWGVGVFSAGAGLQGELTPEVDRRPVAPAPTTVSDPRLRYRQRGSPPEEAIRAAAQKGTARLMLAQERAAASGVRPVSTGTPGVVG